MPSFRCWAIILAGGEGERMRSHITPWLGGHRPKQYCTFVGTRSMLQHTVDRALPLVGGEQVVTIIDRSHRTFLKSEGHREIVGRILEQPCQKDTGPGILLPATYILAEDPAATVLIFPSDHFVYPEKRFQVLMKQAVSLAESEPERLILLGALPDRAETDYGWILPGTGFEPPDSIPLASEIDTFLEKPSAAVAEDLVAAGCYWNTMIMAVKVRCLWRLGLRLVPDVARHFEILHQLLRGIREGWIDPKMESAALESLYESVPAANFSRDVLARATEDLLLLPMTGMEWSDWGRPYRIAESLDRLGKESLLPVGPDDSTIGPVEAEIVQ